LPLLEKQKVILEARARDAQGARRQETHHSGAQAFIVLALSAQASNAP